MSLPWYAGVFAALVVFAVAGGLFALAAWTAINVVFTVAAMVVLFGFVPLFGGMASLFRQLFGEKALRVSAVTGVLLIIVTCSAFLVLVAIKSK